MNKDRSKEWVKAVLQLIVEVINGVGDNERLDALIIQYEDFTDEEKNMVHRLILEQFDVKDSILILSFINNVMKLPGFSLDMAKQIYKVDYGFKELIMLELQTKNIPYKLKKKLHERVVCDLASNLTRRYEYIPVENRVKNRIVIIAEQLLSLRHAPTKLVMEYIYTLVKYYEYDVRLYVCTEDYMVAPDVALNGYVYNSVDYNTNVVEYKGIKIPYYQYLLSETSWEQYEKMLRDIYDYNPEFVLELGVINPIADLPEIFTTTVNQSMQIKAPVSEADILLRYVQMDETAEREYQEALSPHQIQLFMNKKFPALFDITGKSYKREELGLSADKFVVAIVGNRLDIEVTDEFLEIIKDILDINERIDFVVIGDVVELDNRVEQMEISHRIHFLGYCGDLYGMYESAVDLYLNPKRTGGGWSSGIALYAGVPVVTMPNCDVAYNVGSSFIVNDYNEMKDIVVRYAEDKEFYNRQREEALEYRKHNGEAGVVEFVGEMLAKVKGAMK